jgi:DNA modification methylase
MSKQEKIVCLGKEFISDEERREYYRNELRTKLPELKKIEGFPIGEDEDIITLSDPPYYTACPNPWLNDFIAEWEKEKESIQGRQKGFHVEEPYASDVSEGKNNSIYKAHSYHTKVPHPAIIRYIQHYTQKGDIILDGFAGTGMTGVASTLLRNNKIGNLALSEIGERHSILNDLSPAASFISYNYNTPVDGYEIKSGVEKILTETERELSWMYETKHSNGKTGKINFTVLSEVFICPNCSNEFTYWKNGYDYSSDIHFEKITCPICKVETDKRNLDRAWETTFDNEINKTVSRIKIQPVLIKYTCGNKKFEKDPDEFDLRIWNRIKDESIPDLMPLAQIPKGDKTGEPLRMGISFIHQMFTRRNFIYISTFIKLAKERYPNSWQNILFLITGIIPRASLMHKFKKGQTTGTTSGTLYIPSLIYEYNVFKMITERSRYTKDVYKEIKYRDNVQTNQSATSLINVNSSSIDYIFTDPPFGANLMYSELNLIWEAWLQILTNSDKEAIENKSQGKSTLDYQELMTECFVEYFRVLKPGKWMTVEFSNTSAAVWNGIQTSLQKAGFIIANVAGLDKKQGSFNAVNNATSVKQDLVISCYKQSLNFEKRFQSESGEVVVWDFLVEHLHHLPTHVKKDNNTTAIIERSPKILYDRLITFYLMRGLPVPIDARAFQEGLKQRFIERDGMYFTAEQAAEYDEKKAKSPNFVQLSLIVSNESDAIEWLKDRLRKQAQKYQDIMPDFRIATQSLRKGDRLPELQKILDESFIQETDGKWRTPDPGEAKDRETLRTKVLLKEFSEYVTAISQPKAKKLKEVRVEALRAGFKNSWEQKDFKTIVTLGDMIPQNILLEDEQLLMYYDIAKDRI